MELTKTGAREALGDVSKIGENARKRILYKGADALYVIWGVVWMVAFTLQQFVGHRMIAFGSVAIPIECFTWLPLVALGIAGSVLVVRRRTIVRGPRDTRVGIFWWLLFGYFYVFGFILWPVIDQKALYSESGMRVMVAAASVLPMFAYVVMGLWGFGNYMTWVGLGVTATTIVGLLVVPTYFYLWMAVFGGGALLATGMVIHYRWART